MCDCTATADMLAASTYEDTWNHATTETAYIDPAPGTENLGRYSPKLVKDGSGNPVGKYIILINGATDASFVITRAQWTTATAAGAVPGDMNTSLAIEGSMSISEPKGVAFLDQVVKCSIALGVDSSQVVYVLKTFFVGHGFDPTTSNNDVYEQITDIPPLNFICYDVTGSFTEAGGSYEMSFVAAGHGAARLPQYAKAVNAMSITAGNSLQSTLARLQDNININYDKYFQCVVDQIRGSQGVDPQPLIDSLRRVNYVIEVGTDYQNDSYTVTDQPEQYKTGANCDDPVHVTFPSSTSIEGAIRQIMSMSNQVQRDAATGDSNGVKYDYKIHTALRSAPQSGQDSSKLDYTVYYRVERFMVPKTVSYDSQFAALQDDDDKLKANPMYDTIRRNIIEFDYIYTGKNIDILEFDMKVNMGLAYLQTATLANTFKSQLERGPNRQTSASTADVNNMFNRFGGGLMQIPVYFGSQIKTPGQLNAQDANVSIQSGYSLAKHASLEVAEAKMRIVGNTELLRSTNKTSSPEQMIRSLNETKDAPFVASNTPDSANFHDWSRVPAFAKVRIKMPRNNDDFSLFTGQGIDGNTDINQVGFADYARDFWFDGYYYVCGIDHIFDNGEFSQTLDMIGLPKKSAFQSTRPGSGSEINISSGVLSCYDNAVGCVSSTTSNGSSSSFKPLDPVPVTPPSGAIEPTTRPDAVTVLNGKYQLSDVTGWDKAAPEVQRAIVQAANQVGVDPILMAMFAAKESSFRARATASPASSATGLFQFIKSTWNGMVKQGKAQTLVTSPGTSPQPNDPRFDPFNNAIAGANFLRDNSRAIGSTDPGDLYLAHFLGPATAAKVISADRASSGSQLLSTALGASTAAGIARANPTIVNSRTTVGNLRGWASVAMAKLLKGGTKTTNTNKPATTQSIQTAAVPVSVPRTADQADVRKAENAIAAQNNCEAQAKKAEAATPCGPRPTLSNDAIRQGDIRKMENAAAIEAATPQSTTGPMPGQANPINIA